jgi:cell division septal protein FtsQ
VLPSTIDVYVSERRPFGICRQASQLYLVAADGTLIDEFGPKYATFDLPIIDGLFPAPAASRVRPRSGASRVSRASRAAQPAAPRADPARAALAARVVEAIEGTDELARRVSQIDVSNAHDAVVILDGDPALLHVGEERFRERLLSYLEIARALRERIPDIDYVDLRFEQRLYVKPRGRAEGTAMQLPAAGKTF